MGRQDLRYAGMSFAGAAAQGRRGMQMRNGRNILPIAVFVLVSFCLYCDDTLKIKNSAEAMAASIVYLRGQNPSSLPGSDIQWQEKTVFSGGPQDMVTTSKQFTSGNWIVEIYQGLAPLRNTVYQVTVFGSTEGWYWKGSIKADGGIKEEVALKQLSGEEKKKIAEELLGKNRNPAPIGGYGH
jgi:hypothetical protein